MWTIVKRANEAVSIGLMDATLAYSVTGSLLAALAIAVAPLLADPLKGFPR